MMAAVLPLVYSEKICIVKEKEEKKKCNSSSFI